MAKYSHVELARGVFLIAVRSLMRNRYKNKFQEYKKPNLSDVTGGLQQLGMIAWECVDPDSDAVFFGVSTTDFAVVEKIILPGGSVLVLEEPYPLNFAEEPSPTLMQRLLAAA